MTITRKSKIKEIAASAEALAIVHKYLPDMDPENPQMKPAMGMSLKTLCSFPQTGIKKDVANAMFDELEAANID